MVFGLSQISLVLARIWMIIFISSWTQHKSQKVIIEALIRNRSDLKIGFQGVYAAGEVCLCSSNPNDHPFIGINYLLRSFDRRVVIEAVRGTMKLLDIHASQRPKSISRKPQRNLG